MKPKRQIATEKIKELLERRCPKCNTTLYPTEIYYVEYVQCEVCGYKEKK